MHRIVRALAVVFVILPLAAPASAQESLYKRLGGYDAIAAVTDDFLGRLMRNRAFERFVDGFSTETQRRVRQQIVDFICEKTGGPCFYTGEDMKTVHAGIGITKEEWDKAVALFGESLTALKVPAQEAQDLATLIVPLEADIVEIR